MFYTHTYLFQSAGIWSEGIFAAPTVSRKSYNSSSSNHTGAEKNLRKSKLNTKIIIDAKEEEKLKNLLRDDFMDDGTNDDKMIPISLPRVIKEEFSNEEIEDKKPVISESGEGRIIISFIISSNFYIFFLFYSYKYKRRNFK